MVSLSVYLIILLADSIVIIGDLGLDAYEWAKNHVRK